VLHLFDIGFDHHHARRHHRTGKFGGAGPAGDGSDGTAVGYRDISLGLKNVDRGGAPENPLLALNRRRGWRSACPLSALKRTSIIRCPLMTRSRLRCASSSGYRRLNAGRCIGAAVDNFIGWLSPCTI
jgi:hypothetical protein